MIRTALTLYLIVGELMILGLLCNTGYCAMVRRRSPLIATFGISYFILTWPLSFLGARS